MRFRLGGASHRGTAAGNVASALQGAQGRELHSSSVSVADGREGKWVQWVTLGRGVGRGHEKGSGFLGLAHSFACACSSLFPLLYVPLHYLLAPLHPDHRQLTSLHTPVHPLIACLSVLVCTLPNPVRRSVRIVNVASAVHLISKIQFDDLQRERWYGPWEAYGERSVGSHLRGRRVITGSSTVSKSLSSLPKTARLRN